MTRPMGYGNKDGENITYQYKQYTESNHAPNIIVLDDAALGFRFSMNRDAWPKTIQKEKVDNLDWVLLKMSSPVANGDLFRSLTKKFRNYSGHFYLI